MPAWLAALLAAAALALVGCGRTPGRSEAPATATPHPWPMFRGGADHRGDFAARPTPAWRERWRVELGERIDASAVITSDARAIVATREGLVVALDLATGAERARARLGGGVWASPALAGDVLVLAGDSGHLHGLDARTLAPRWRVPAPSRRFSGLTVFEGEVWLCSGETLLALDPRSGAIRVRARLLGACFGAPAVDAAGSRVFVATRDGGVSAHATATGEALWLSRTSDGLANDAAPVVAGELLLVGSNDRALHAFRASDGREAWVSPTANWVVSTAAVSAGTVYTGDDGGLLRALALDEGSERWRVRVGDDLASSPTVVGSLVVFGAHDGELHAVDATTGEPRPDIDAGAAIFASPAVAADGAIVIGTHAGRVLCIE